MLEVLQEVWLLQLWTVTGMTWLWFNKIFQWPTLQTQFILDKVSHVLLGQPTT